MEAGLFVLPKLFAGGETLSTDEPVVEAGESALLGCESCACGGGYETGSSAMLLHEHQRGVSNTTTCLLNVFYGTG